MKNSFDALISKLGMAMESISEREDMKIETSKNEKQREKETMKQRTISKNHRTTTKGVTQVQWEYQKEKKGTDAIFEAIMIKNLTKLMSETK